MIIKSKVTIFEQSISHFEKNKDRAVKYITLKEIHIFWGDLLNLSQLDLSYFNDFFWCYANDIRIIVWDTEIFFWIHWLHKSYFRKREMLKTPLIAKNHVFIKTSRNVLSTLACATLHIYKLLHKFIWTAHAVLL